MESTLNAAKKGDTLIILARNKVSSSALTSAYTQLNATGKIEFIEGNLNSFDSIYSDCQEGKSKYFIIARIVNSMGFMNFELKKFIDNIEETLHVNLFSHVLNCHLLLENLKNLLTLT
jgi:short-subunit dehydrogenase